MSNNEYISCSIGKPGMGYLVFRPDFTTQLYTTRCSFLAIGKYVACPFIWVLPSSGLCPAGKYVTIVIPLYKPLSTVYYTWYFDISYIMSNILYQTLLLICKPLRHSISYHEPHSILNAVLVYTRILYSAVVLFRKVTMFNTKCLAH